METIQQAGGGEATCCGSSSAQTNKASSATVALGLLILAAVVSYTSRHGGLNLFDKVSSSVRCTPPCPVPVSLVAALAGSSSSQVATTTDHHNVSIPFKPIIAELGVVALLQMIGFPALGRAGVLARRIKFMRIGRSLHLPAPFLRQLSRHTRFLTRASAKVWKTAETIYSKTSLSKLVQRIKKLLKIVSHAQDDDDESDEAEHGHH